MTWPEDWQRCYGFRTAMNIDAISVLTFPALFNHIGLWPSKKYYLMALVRSCAQDGAD
jgi:hypothetical protein